MKGNGNIVALLERIAAGQDELRDEVRALRGEVTQTNSRLDHLIGFLGKHHTDHEQRLAALESAVFKNKSGY